MEFCQNNNEVACVYIMSTSTSGGSKSDIETFINENNITIPVILDESGILYSLCNINAYPTMFVANKKVRY